MPKKVEITDIIPFNEFGGLAELELDSGAFDTTKRLAYAPELDDLDDIGDEEPLPLGRPASHAPQGRYADDPYADGSYADRFSAGDACGDDACGDDLYPDDPSADDLPADDRYGATYRSGHRSRGAQHAPAPRTRGGHREAATSVMKGRLLIAAMAAGAAAAAAHSVVNTDRDRSGPASLAASAEEISSGVIEKTTDGVQLVTVKSGSNPLHNEEFVKAAAFAQERAQREARLQRPLFVMPTSGIPTSGFGYRWGVLHAGIDIANSIGTPIYAVSDGVVIDAGPVAGYGMWVKLRHSDGTVSLYGHVNTTLVDIGERVMAGDQIATMGNRGDSTGPHLHFEIMPDGTHRIDPAPWLAERGLSIGNISG